MSSERSAAEVIRDLLEEIVEKMKLDAVVRVSASNEEIVGTVEGEDIGRFIGRYGSTIDAVQHLAQRALLANGAEPTRVVIDADGYRERRRTVLEEHAASAAERALREGRSVELEAMSAAERRVVHEYLRERDDVSTHSEGTEPERRIVVSPA